MWINDPEGIWNKVDKDMVDAREAAECCCEFCEAENVYHDLKGLCPKIYNKEQAGNGPCPYCTKHQNSNSCEMMEEQK